MTKKHNGGKKIKNKISKGKSKESKQKEPGNDNHQIPNPAPPPNAPFMKLVPLSDGQMMARGTVITKAPDNDKTLRHAEIWIPGKFENLTVIVNLYSTSQSPAFTLNNYGVVYYPNTDKTQVGADFTNTRLGKDLNPLPEPDTNIFNCDFIVIGYLQGK